MITLTAKHVTLLVRLWWADETRKEETAKILEAAPRFDTARGLCITALDPHSGERWGFKNLQELLAFMQSQVEASEKFKEEKNVQR